MRKKFCDMFSESSTGSWAELQLPCCPSKRGELPENMLQNIFLNLPPQTVPHCQIDNLYFVAIADTFPCTTTSSLDTSRVTRSESSVWRCLPRTIRSCPAAPITRSDYGISVVQHVLASCMYRKVNRFGLGLAEHSCYVYLDKQAFMSTHVHSGAAYRS